MSTTTAPTAKQARNLLAEARNASTYTKFYTGGNASQENGFDALRTALVAQGTATLAIAEELAELREAVRQVAACRAELAQIAAAIQNLAGAHERSTARLQDALSDAATSIDKTVGKGLKEIAEEVRGCDETTTIGTIDIATAIREHSKTGNSAVFGVIDVMDRPRWWQWRRRNQRQQATIVEGAAR
ncbi:hypothetical protein [Nonomuraea roseoviolacea]|uniref:NTP pyrophosphatase (Non-canonical NTP hydrolase) n=1 Tax=Nonomuraea roseoviolacea subsp. carminata TaxID=160689 RepID=A0ABT1K992_9ACTN|nr:hypothetical protein [Nonomuraea roseoviolacea]MCP2350583.1 NTP pyrophosphatase (non-canonical NTP hydrolase) [Nonomuraea roseoviolacea subsp. carminata]